jgi:hypothetical protein
LIEALGKILGVVVKNLYKIENLPANVLGSILELVQKNMDSFVGEKGLLVNKNKLLTTNR